MPKFAYTAVAPDGQTVEGTEKADNAGAVEIDLLERDLQVVHVEEKRGLMQFELTRKRVPRSEVMHFSRQLAVFIRAGIPILDAIEAIRDEATNTTFRTVLTEIGDALRGGDTLSAAVSSCWSSVPVSSPTRIMRRHTPGNRLVAARGRASPSPSIIAWRAVVRPFR